MIAFENRGDAVAESAGGDPPALFTSTSSRPSRSSVNRDHLVDLVGLADVGGDEQRLRASPERGIVSGSCRPQITTSAPASRNRSVIPRPTPRLRR